ncbi:MAG: uroporphyrinogen-III synthase [Acetobacteraceae bacterium]
MLDAVAAERRGVLITRPEPDASETAARVAALGFEPIVAPVLRIRLGSVTGPAQVDAILVTSRNAVPALPERYRHVPLLAVGSATAARARAAGFATVLDAEGDAAALAGLARERCAPHARLLLVHAQGQGGPLLSMLRTSGFRVHGRRGYAVVSVPEFPRSAAAALRAGTVRTALFLSAETARAFVRLLPDTLCPCLAAVQAVAIGTPAADALALLPWHRVRVSVRPTLDNVLALL